MSKRNIQMNKWMVKVSLVCVFFLNFVVLYYFSHMGTGSHTDCRIIPSKNGVQDKSVSTKSLSLLNMMVQSLYEYAHCNRLTSTNQPI